MSNAHEPSTNDAPQSERDKIRQSLKEITSDISSALFDARLVYPMYVCDSVHRDQGQSRGAAPSQLRQPAFTVSATTLRATSRNSCRSSSCVAAGGMPGMTRSWL